MTLPKTVRVLGKDYDVVVVPDNEDYGNYHDKEQAIHLMAGMGHDLERDTLLHEIIHAIDEGLRLRLGEKRVNTLGTVIYALLKENPQLVKYVMQKPRKNGSRKAKEAEGAERGVQEQDVPRQSGDSDHRDRPQSEGRTD